MLPGMHAGAGAAVLCWPPVVVALGLLAHCRKAHAKLRGLRAGNSTFVAFIENFTSTTYIMVVTSDPAISASRPPTAPPPLPSILLDVARQFAAPAPSHFLQLTSRRC